MTTGMIDFIIKSGFMTAMAEIPTPDFAVPYAAPNAERKQLLTLSPVALRSVESP